MQSENRGQTTAIIYYGLSTIFWTLTLTGEHTKNGEDARKILPVSVANELAAWIRETERLPDDPLLDVASHIDRYFMQDLGKVEAGRTVVFHSLRHSTATLLAAAGATQKEVMAWMRNLAEKVGSVLPIS